jgi:threonine/homoserine/homoserine lactone efflux protein
MDPAVVASFWAVSMIFVLTPGADWAYAIAAGLHHRNVIPAVSGLLAGHVVATGVVAAGVGALVAQVPFGLTVLTIIGSAYLIWLGVSTLGHPATIQAADQPVKNDWLSQAARGLGVSGLNPKVFLLFLALLPQFIDDAVAWPSSAQMLVLGGVHLANCALIYIAVGVTAKLLLRTRPGVARVVSRTSGAILTLLGAGLLIEQFLAFLR